MRDKFICGLDLGTNKIAAALAKIDKTKRFSIIALEAQKIDPPGSDVSPGSIQNLLSSIKHKHNVEIEDLIVNLSGGFISSKYSRAAIPLSDRGARIINRRIVNRLSFQARNLCLDLEEGLLHEFPQEYIIDSKARLDNPLGRCARRLEVETLLISTQLKDMQNTTRLVSRAGYEIKDFVFSGLASGWAVCDKEDMVAGCAIIDIGAGLTEIAIFKDSILRAAHIISFGGNDLTNALVEALKIPFSVAEEIKTSYALVLPKDADEEKEIIIKKNSGFNSIKHSQVVKAIGPKIDNLAKNIKKKIASSSFRDKLEKGVIITGGMSLLDGFLEMMELKLEMPVKLGIPKDVEVREFKAPVFSTSVGLVRYGRERYLERVSKLENAASWIDQIIAPLKFVYQEYF
ncbi:MAG: cell division protein FtsA [Candidatus Omnitrophota bacterium]